MASSSSSNPEPVHSIQECNSRLGKPGSLYETENRVIDGQVYRVYKNLPDSLRQVWDNSSTKFSNRKYIYYQGNYLTYGETNAKVVAFANALKEKYGVVKGDRVAVVMRNLPEFVISFWAIESIGAICVAVNAWLTEEPLTFCLVNTSAKVAIVDPERHERLQKTLPELKNAGLVDLVVAKPEKGVSYNNSSLFDDIITQYSTYKKMPDVDILPEDDATIFFTSGTTSLPKGVLATNRQYISNLPNVTIAAHRAIIRAGGEIPTPSTNDPPKACLITVPFFHVTANQSFLLMHTSAGNKLILMRKWDVKEAVDLIKSERVTSAGGVPSMVAELVSTDLGKDPNCSLESFTFGGAPAPETLALNATNAFVKAVPMQAYGLTETNSIALSIAGPDYIRKPASTGLPSPINDIMICNPHNEREVPCGEVGELYVRGANVSKCYYNNPEATRCAFTNDHWFRTGDLACTDAEGFVYIKDRAKDIIIRGGENIASVAVENALYQDCRVSDCAVVPLKHDLLGEEVGAIVTIRPEYRGRVSECDLQCVAAKCLPRHSVPVCIEIRYDPIPRSATGKIVKRELKRELNIVWERRKRTARRSVCCSRL